MKMMESILILLVLLLAALSVYLYARTSKTMRRLDEMLDRAIEDRFSESSFTEERLSKLETKMYRYLSAGKTARNKIIGERNAVKTLVSDISHQTKTPIANILLYTQLLKESEELNENGKEMLRLIEDQTEKLSFLIQSLVKLSRLENGIVRVDPKETGIRQLLDGLDHTAAAQKKGIRLTISEIPELTAVFDLKWTREALSNILDNAVKYTPRGGTVTVSAQAYEMFVRIDISDTGIGMSEDETARIFNRFYRSPAVSAEKGVGIGLYLTREILTKEGGYIKVSSKPGSGSVFSVFLAKK